jgi:hypothetical protein
MTKLKEICDGLLSAKDLQPHDGKTFCNVAVRRAAMNFGYTGFHADAMANEMVANMRDYGDFEKVDGAHAQSLAMGGRLVISGLQFVQCAEAHDGRCQVRDCPYCKETREPAAPVDCEGRIVQMVKLAHGHVAVVYPAPMQRSGSWNKTVPMLANIGKKNGLMRASQAFPLEPDYFVLKEK